jgi:sugar lactone lactonase YvrE
VLATRAGDLFVPHWPNGVTTIGADGTQTTWLADVAGPDLCPNAIALSPDGSFLIANLGEAGGVWRLRRNGAVQPFVLEADGAPLPPANFVTTDAGGRTWISVSTRHVPRQLAWRADVADGFIVLVDRRGSRIVADGLCYTNEVRPDPSGRWLYAAETYGRRVVRFPLRSDGTLGARETVFEGGRGFFPDGFAFDEEGAIWVTSLVSNRLLRLVGHRADTVLEDANGDVIDAAERAFAASLMRAEHLGPIPGTRLQQVTSIAFGGADLRTAYLGSLHGTSVYRFRAPVAGVPPVHWHTLVR